LPQRPSSRRSTTGSRSSTGYRRWIRRDTAGRQRRSSLTPSRGNRPTATSWGGRVLAEGSAPHSAFRVRQGFLSSWGGDHERRTQQAERGRQRQGGRAQDAVRHRHERGPFVFCTAKGIAFTEGETRQPLERIRKRAGLRAMTWHVCRHTFCSHLVMRGVPLRVVQVLAGHTSYKTTERYAHLTPEVRAGCPGARLVGGSKFTDGARSLSTPYPDTTRLRYSTLTSRDPRTDACCNVPQLRSAAGATVLRLGQ
jgi:hypothetical protein